MKKVLAIIGLVVLLAACSQQSKPELNFETQKLGTPEFDAAFSVSSSGSHLYVGGYTDGSLAAPIIGQVDGWLRKYNGFTAIWTKQFGTPGAITQVTSVLANADGSAYVVGDQLNEATPFISKYDQFGQRLWQKTFPGQGNRRLFIGGGEIARDASGNMYIPVIEGDSATTSVVKLSTHGNILKTIIIGKGGGPDGSITLSGDIDVDPFGNLYALTTVYRNSPVYGLQYDVLLKRYDNQGKLVSNRGVCTGAGDQLGGNLDVDNLGNIYITCDFNLYKLTNTGFLIWSIPFGAGSSLAVDSQNNVYVAGCGLKVDVTKRNSLDGSFLWGAQFGSKSTQCALGITVTDQVYVVGSADQNYSSGFTDRDAFVAKIRKTDGRVLSIDQ